MHDFYKRRLRCKCGWNLVVHGRNRKEFLKKIQDFRSHHELAQCPKTIGMTRRDLAEAGGFRFTLELA
jgi:hypothetical protein